MMSAMAELGKIQANKEQERGCLYKMLLMFSGSFHDARHVSTDSASPLSRVYGILERSNLNRFIDWSRFMCNVCVNEARCRLFTVHYWELSGAAVGCSRSLTAERRSCRVHGTYLS